MFKQYSDSVHYPAIEERIQSFWDERSIFQKSISSRPADKYFTFYEGPPTANGKPGIHHVMARSLKDLICRYKTLQGFQVHRKAGWDTHGLPVEIEVEKALGIKNKSEIPVFGVEKYNAACRESVFSYKDLWEKMTERMGYWIDFPTAYVTCTNEYIESVWWSLKTLFDKGLIFKDYKIVPQDPYSETVLSSHELALGYRMTKDPSVYTLFELITEEGDPLSGAYILVWTTTPWTLISNVALAIGEEIDYVLVENKEKKIVLAKARLSVLDGEYTVLAEMKGKDLAGRSYRQLLSYLTPEKKAFYIVPGDFVSTQDGSGVVHIAPAFGADDYEVSKKYDLPLMQPVNAGGRFTEEVTDFVGQFVKDADAGIILKLKAEGKIYKKETIEHSYPFSWRKPDVPVIYYARESWFIRTTSVAQRMIELNKTINWQPPEVGSGRFGNWLEDNKDWALSRDRFWATPLPIWISEEGDSFAIGSIAELKLGFIEKDGKRIPVADISDIDLHKPFVDKILFEKDGKIYRRTPELIDVWYDSGAMPFAQYHYPFENKEWFEANFPADFISEGIDQTRGWFYTMHAIATMLFDSIAYKNILVNDLILDEKGQKMSKSRGNAVDPFALFDKYGADATRWYLIVNNPPWRPTLFSEEDLAETQRKFFGTLLNSYAFFALYANIDGFDHKAPFVPYEERPEIDRWIISKLNSVIEEYQEHMDAYDVTRAARLISSFTIDQLSNWYVRRSRRRFWKSEMNAAKVSAYQTLYECLEKIAILLSPFAPFFAEELFLNLNSVSGANESESVHLSRMPKAGYRDKELEIRMDDAQQVVYLARAIRAKANLKVRQPLQKIMVVIDAARQPGLTQMKDVILDEVNIKELLLLSGDADIVEKSAKPNFKSLGPKHGKKVNPVANAIRGLTREEISLIETGSDITITVDGAEVLVSPSDVEVQSSQITGWAVESEHGITVALDTTVTEELLLEGIAREFVNRIQNLRKDSGFEVMDRITIAYNAENAPALAIERFKQYIAGETLADEISASIPDGAAVHKLTIGEYECSAAVTKV